MKHKNEIIKEINLVKYHQNKIDDDDLYNTIEKWINQSESNLNYYKKVIQLWKKSAKTEHIFNKLDSEKSLKKLKQTLVNQSKTKIKYLSKIIKVAALILILFGIFTIIKLGNTKSDLIVVKASINEVKTVILPDSSIISLKSKSTIKYPKKFRKEQRLIELEGEAFFEVNSNKNKPFVVETQYSFTKVLGTSFLLKSDTKKQQDELIVATGKVIFGIKDDDLKKESFIAGEKGIIEVNNNKLTKLRNEDINYASWKNGILIFKNTPLDKVIIDLSKHYNKKFIISNDSIKTRTLNAKYENLKLNELISILELSLELKIEEKDSVIILK